MPALLDENTRHDIQLFVRLAVVERRMSQYVTPVFEHVGDHLKMVQNER